MTETKPVLFNLKITLGGETLKAQGLTALEALRAIEPPVKIFTKADIELSLGKKKMKQTWQPARVKRLFYPISQVVLSKQLEYLLK